MTRRTPHPALDESRIDVHAVLARRRQVAVIWSIDDVRSVRPDLTPDQAWEVLLECEAAHDCEHGFTWTHIENVADELYPLANPSSTSKGDLK